MWVLIHFFFFLPLCLSMSKSLLSTTCSEGTRWSKQSQRNFLTVYTINKDNTLLSSFFFIVWFSTFNPTESNCICHLERFCFSHLNNITQFANVQVQSVISQFYQFSILKQWTFPPSYIFRKNKCYLFNEQSRNASLKKLDLNTTHISNSFQFDS